MTRRAASDAGLSLDVMVEADVWRQAPGAEETIRRAIGAATRFAQADGELAILLADDATIRKFNKQWRGKDKATNVLSFPGAGAASDAQPRHLGDIVIAYETTAREACADEKPFMHHLAHLSVHGYLHLLGYDHEEDDAAEMMERLETDILASLGLPDPYLEREAKA